jgi:hypothetical protein
MALLLLSSALDADERSASCPGRFTPGEGAPRTHCIGVLVGLRAGEDAVKYRKISCFCQESKPRPFSP